MLFAAAAAALCACSQRPLPDPIPAPVAPLTVVPEVSPWPGIFSRARRAADAERFGEADRLLAEFAQQHASSPESSEATFWRALFSIDPANTTATVSDQIAAFDSYIAAGPSLPRYTEARILRRMVEAIDSTRALVVAVRATAEARDRAKSDEVKRLSDELEKTLAEMERIKRRLAPRPPDEKRPPQ
jgi:hypothetical protein